MPTATAARQKKSRAPGVVVSPGAVAAFVAESPTEEALVFNPFDEAVPFFDALAMLSDNEWARYLVYLYRLDPRVRNPEGEAAFIDKYQRPFDEADIQAKHGGGKYLLILKDDVMQKRDPAMPSPRERRWRCRISGDPKLTAGQTLQTSPGVVLPPAGATETHDGARPAGGSSDIAALADVLKEVLLQRNNGGGANGELTAQAYKTGLSIVSEAAKVTASSTTGNPMMDKLLERIIDANFGGGRKNGGDSDLRDTLAKITLERLQNPQPAEGKDPLSQLGFVKDLLGVDSIADLIRPVSGNDAWKSKLVEMGATLIGNLPQLFQMFLQSQQAAFQRQLQAEQFRRQNGPIPLPASPETTPRIQVMTPGPGPAAPQQPTTQQAPPPAPGEAMGFNPVQMTIEEIAVDFEHGLDGQVTARLVRQKFPLVIEQMKPMLADMDQVKLFAQNTPPLNQFAGDDEFPQFLTEFVNEILHPAEDDGAPAA